MKHTYATLAKPRLRPAKRCTRVKRSDGNKRHCVGGLCDRDGTQRQESILQAVKGNLPSCSRALALGFTALAFALHPAASQLTFAARRCWTTGLNARSVLAARGQRLVGNKSPQKYNKRCGPNHGQENSMWDRICNKWTRHGRPPQHTRHCQHLSCRTFSHANENLNHYKFAAGEQINYPSGFPVAAMTDTP